MNIKDDPNFLREMRLAPYRKGMGPTFRLRLWATNRRDSRGQDYLRYEFSQTDVGSRKSHVIFEGSDFSGSPMDADDSLVTARGLLRFLTLRPGDTDDDYFANYTPEQHDFARQHAETLSIYIGGRRGRLLPW